MTDVLDHGYVRLIETWGSDERIVEAARMSTQKGFLGWGDDSPCRYDAAVADTGVVCSRGMANCSVRHVVGDEKLLKYLYDHAHSTPFEMAGAIFEIQAPIFVFREWHRHRTQSYNEMSARYAPLPNVNYVPTVDRLLLGGGHLTKQAGAVAGANALDAVGAEAFREALQRMYVAAEEVYQTALLAGVPKELARVHLPVGRYSRMRASANLRNWLAFLTLRTTPQAQYEIRQYALAVQKHLADHFPRTLALFGGAR